MEYLHWFIMPIAVAVVFAAIRKSALKAEKNMTEDNFVVRQSKIIVWVGIIFALFCSTMITHMLIFPNDTNHWVLYLGGAVFALLGVFLAIYSAYWEIRVNGNQIKYNPVFGKSKEFTFGDIVKVKIKFNPNNNLEEMTAFSDVKKIFEASTHCAGYNVLLARLKNENIPFESNTKK